VELRQSRRPDNHTPDVTLETLTLAVEPGADRPLALRFEHTFTDTRHAFICFMPDAAIGLRCSERRVTGVLALCHEGHASVAKSAVQTPPGDIGVEQFEFWLPRRRPGGHNLALKLEVPLAGFGADNVINGVARPVTQPNAWVADPADPAPALLLQWDQPQTVARVELGFDTDFDHPMESVLWGHPERAMAFCVRRYRLVDELTGRVLAAREDNHETRNVIVLDPPVRTGGLRLDVEHPSPQVPAALFEIRCYATREMAE
jgi:hypothetical protein